MAFRRVLPSIALISLVVSTLSHASDRELTDLALRSTPPDYETIVNTMGQLSYLDKELSWEIGLWKDLAKARSCVAVLGKNELRQRVLNTETLFFLISSTLPDDAISRLEAIRTGVAGLTRCRPDDEFEDADDEIQAIRRHGFELRKLLHARLVEDQLLLLELAKFQERLQPRATPSTRAETERARKDLEYVQSHPEQEVPTREAY